MRVKSNLIVCLSLCLSACGGSQQPAEEPAADSSAASTTEDASDASESAPDKAEAKSDEAEKSKESAKKDKVEAKEDSSTSGPKITRTTRDILTAPDVIFMFSFNQSDIKQQFEKQCDKDDPKKRADCMTKAKKKIDFDGIQFKQEKGTWYWLTISRKGKVLTNLHKVPIEFGKEDEHSIVVKPIGKDEGKARGGAPGETKIEVPNEYEIVIQDPKYGKMVYEAKIGLTDK